jgi:serine/threonine protein kinase
MNPERWRRIEQLYSAAVGRTTDEQAAYLAEACGEDQELRHEVESLLCNEERGALLERPALEVAARHYVPVVVPDLVGRKLGRYQVISQLGSGGMGAVYLARDMRLKRDVALKVVRPDSLADPHRTQRFIQEARAASALNHPHIVGIHDVDQIDGVDFIVMEYVPGRTLTEVIGHRGLPLTEALAYAIQIADALTAAHAAGIVHRDLKPGNIMLNDRREVKVLDFGLAKLMERPTASDSTSMETAVHTAKGTIVGTAAYMSPEQTEGKEVDARSDIFSFGAVLFEMLTGEPAFQRDSTSATIAAILRDHPPPLAQSRPDLPPELEQLVELCLRKKADQRCRAMADVKKALEDLSHKVQAGQLVVSPLGEKSRSTLVRRWLWMGAAGGLLAAAMAVWFLVRRGPPHQPLQVTRLTFDSRLALHPAISADGKYMAYASDRGTSGDMHIWVQELPTGEPVRLTKDESNEDYPAFSPDGTKIAFRSERDGGGIYVVPLLGGEPRLLAPQGTRPQYSPDGRLLLFASPLTTERVIVFGGRSGLGGPGAQEKLYPHVFLMPADGGERRQLQTESDAYFYPVWSPDGTELLYMGANLTEERWTHWYIVPVSGGSAVRLGTPEQLGRFEAVNQPPVPLLWLRGNRILFSACSGDAVNLWSARLSPSKRRITEPLDQLTFGPGNINYASATNAGPVVFGSVTAQTRLWELQLKKGETQSRGDPVPLPSHGEIDAWPSLSDTGKLAYISWKASKWSLWLRDARSGKETWLASANGDFNSVSTFVNRAGSRVAYTTCPGKPSPCNIFTVAASGGAPERVCEDCGHLRSWSSNGAVMVSQQIILEGQKWTGFRINRIETVSGRKTILTEKPGTFLFAPDLSPDGRWIVFQARPALVSEFEQLFVAPADENVPVAPSRWTALTDLQHFDADPRWSRDGQTVYFTSNRDGPTFFCLWALRLDRVTKRPVGPPFAVQHFHGTPRHYIHYPTLSVGPDRMVISLDQVQSDLWMMHLPEEH